MGLFSGALILRVGLFLVWLTFEQFFVHKNVRLIIGLRLNDSDCANSFHQIHIKPHSFFFSIFVLILTLVLSKLGRLFNLQFLIKTYNKPMGLFSGVFLFIEFLGLFWGGLIFGLANYQEITTWSPYIGFSRLILSVFSTLSITVNAMGILFKPRMTYQNKIPSGYKVTRLFMKQAEIPTSHHL